MTRAIRSRTRTFVALLAGLAMVGVGGVAVVSAEQSADAASAATMLRAFDPADIISDEVMFNPSTMTAGAVQAFLNDQVPACRTGYTCLRNYRQTTLTKTTDQM